MEADNLCTLEKLDDEVLINTLKERYQSEQVYTNCGLLLLSINPYKELDIYSHEVANLYRKDYVNLKPHIYSLLETIKSESKIFGEHSIIISGESGAGKTECAKKILEYLNIPELCKIDTILESLGNAKTPFNDNSSRFGKLIRLHKNISINTFLLEKSRVTSKTKNEHNFHIFYYILAKKRLTISNDYIDFVIKAESYNNEIDGNNTVGFNEESFNPDQITEFSKKYDILIESFATIGLDFSKIEKIMLGIIYLGCLKFENGAIIKDETFNTMIDYLGIDPNGLEDYLLYKTIKVAGETIKKKYSLNDSINLRDSIARLIYASVFEFIVGRINSYLLNIECEVENINILDIFGFEDFNRNGLDQFCINWCNERIYDEFVNETFENQKEILKSEGIIIKKIVENESNKNSIELENLKMKPSIIPTIQKRCGIADLISEESFLNGNSESLGIKLKKYLNLEVGPRNILEINHFLGPVKYDLDDFIRKNKEKASLLGFIKDPIFSTEIGSENIVGFFKNSLDLLFTLLKKTKIKYVKCIKPNINKKPMYFDDKTVHSQLKANGIIQSVEISKYLYPYSLFIDEFEERYPLLKGVEQIKYLVKGNTRYFFNNECLNFIESSFLKYKTRTAEVLTSLIRSMIKKKMEKRKTIIIAFLSSIAARQLYYKEQLRLKEIELKRSLISKIEDEIDQPKVQETVLDQDEMILEEYVNSDSLIKSNSILQSIQNIQAEREIKNESPNLINEINIKETLEEESQEKIETPKTETISVRREYFSDIFNKKSPSNNFFAINSYEGLSLNGEIKNNEKYEKIISELKRELSKYKSFSVNCSNCQILQQKYKVQTQQLKNKQTLELEIEKYKKKLRQYEDVSSDDSMEMMSTYNIFACLIQLYLDYCPVFSNKDIPKDEILSLAHSILFVLKIFDNECFEDNLSVALEEINKRLCDFEENISTVAFILSNLIELKIIAKEKYINEFKVYSGSKINQKSNDIELNYKETACFKSIEGMISTLFNHLCRLQRKILSDVLTVSILEYQHLKEFKSRESIYKKLFSSASISKLIDYYEYFYNLNAFYYIPDVFIINNLSFILSYSDYICFNSILMKKKFLNRNRCMQIAYNLSEIEKFCFNVSFHQGFYNMAYMREMIRVSMGIAKADYTGEYSIEEIADNSFLNSSQINTIIDLFEKTLVKKIPDSGGEKKFIDEPKIVVPSTSSLKSNLKFVRPKFLPEKSIKSILKILKD